MKKIFLVLFFFLFFQVNAQTLKGTVSEEYVPKGFYGSWGVISKLVDSTNPTMFNYESRDVWVLSGYDDVLILENLESGAYSEIRIKEKNKDGKTLNFERQKTVEKGNTKIIYKEKVSFILSGKNFSGVDKFIVEQYKNNDLIKNDSANYETKGVKISGDNP